MDGQESLHVTNFNGIKVYHCTAGKSEQQWRQEFKNKEKQLKKNEEFEKRLTLIHDFSFPECATRIKVSPDGRYIAAAGTYKPRLKLFECENMSMKVDRFCDEEISQIQFLADDYSKIACARNDRTVELHSQQGLYTTIKTPRHIRDLSYHHPTCDLFIASNGNDLYRFNLEQGAFQSSIMTDFSENNGGISAIGQNPKFPLLSLCGRGGVESWDLRDRTSVGFLDILNTLSDAQLANQKLSTTMMISANSSSTKQITSSTASINSLLRSISDSQSPLEATCIRFNDDTGMEVSIGLSTGHVLTYDLRSSKPLAIYDHKYDLPIHSIKYHTQSRTLITADQKTVRLWDYTTSNLTPQQRHLTTINAPAPMNDIAMVDDSGMLFMACDSPQMHIYFVPRLGTVPDWASALESLTEELDHQQQQLLQKQYKILATGVATTTNNLGMAMIGDGSDMSQTVFDDSKFITRDELEQWGMLHLINQKMVQPYMHGFLIKMTLFEQLKEMMVIEGKADQFGDFLDPNNIDGNRNKQKLQTELQFIESRIQKEMDKSRDSGFKLDSTLPTVNQNLAALLLNQENDAKSEKKSRSKLAKEQEQEQKTLSILKDKRFQALFQDEDFDVDYQSAEYRRLNPQLKKSAQFTTEALRRVADPTQETQIRAPTMNDDGSIDNDFLMTERADQTIKDFSGISLKNYEAKGLLGASGFDKSGNASLEAKGQLTAKQIKMREKSNLAAKNKLTAEETQQREAMRIADLAKNEKKAKLQQFLTSSTTQNSNSLITGDKKTSKTSTSSNGLSLSGVKTGVGIADLLSGRHMTGNKNSTEPGTTTKRPLTLADRVRMEEEEKALRERTHIYEQLAKRRDEERAQQVARDTSREQRRSANQSGKKAKNVY